MSEYLYFPGCNIPYRENQYELSARAVAKKLGVELRGANFICCGLNIEPIDEFASLLFSARNIALAEEQELPLVALCNGCYKTLRVADRKLKKDERLRARVNEKLAEIGREYRGRSEVYHFLDVVSSELKPEHIVRKVELRVAPFTGCHSTRPSEYVGFGAEEKLRELIRLCGAKVVRYTDMDKCCGAPLLALGEELGVSIARQRLLSMKARGAEAAVTMCPFCQVSLDTLQVKAEQEFGERYGIASMYITQLIGIALGLKPEELGLGENKTKPEALLKGALR